MGKLDGKTALITGGSSGIGLAAAKRFVDEGAYVFITGRREAELASAAKDIGKNVKALQGDVSNLTAFQYLKAALLSEAGDDTWVLLTNVAFSVTHQLQSDEIDLVAIGPNGVRIIEVKHWTAQWVDGNRRLVDDEADRVTNKARKIGTTLRRICQTLPRVDGAFLITQESTKSRRLVGQKIRGVDFYTLGEWKAAIGFEAPRALSHQQVLQLAHALQPRSALAIDGSPRRLAG
jgi:NAD(P)-dependent dehydrogenase (short-subunit alcohol dehydrogenase family)